MVFHSAMLVAAMPLDPPAGDKYFAFYVINDGEHRIDSVAVLAVSYEWGDSGSSESLDLTFGPIEPGTALEVYRETATELRTALTLRVRDATGDRTVLAEVGRLYARARGLTEIPILNRPGKLATIDDVTAAS